MEDNITGLITTHRCGYYLSHKIIDVAEVVTAIFEISTNYIIVPRVPLPNMSHSEFFPDIATFGR